MGKVTTIGVFDGVHRGHQALVAEAVLQAARVGGQPWVITFDPNPIEVVRPDVAPTRLCSVERRVRLLEELGVDGVTVVRFDPQMSQMSAADFAQQVVVEQVGATHVVVGENFRFGHRAAGDADTLREAGLQVSVLDLLAGGDAPLSSTRVRAAVAAGDMELAAAILGRHHGVEGPVVPGHRRGRELGYPTANVQVDPLAAVPLDGVYAGAVSWHDGERPAAISVGTNPTFGDGGRSVEAYLLDFDGDLYGQRLQVDFWHHIRPMVAFDDVEALKRQMADDVQRTADLVPD